MTTAQIEVLKLGIYPIDERTTLLVEGAFDWMKENTTLEIDIENEEVLKALPACVRLFVIQFVDIMSMSAGVASESIEGLSQSFSNEGKSALIWQSAEELLSNYLKSRVRFVAAQRKWR